jgi:ABC-type uncharacterized transport system substrate-binding protein
VTCLRRSDARFAKGETPQVGVLFGGPKGSAAIAAFTKAMEELGYEDGRTIAIRFLYADGNADRLSTLAGKLAAQKPALIVAVASEAVIAAANATSSIPIVSATGDVDFVGLGLASSLERPGGNVTGMTTNAGEAAHLRIELLKEAMPALSTVTVLMHPAAPANQRLQGIMQATARRHGMTLLPAAVSGPEDLKKSVAAAKADGVQAVTCLQGPFFFFQRRLLAELCDKHRIALAMSEPLSAEAGALLQVNADTPGAAVAAAGFIDQILRGARPADLPIVRHPTN